MYTIISQSSIIEKSHSALICRFEKMFRVNTLLWSANVKKEKGVCARKLFWILLSLVFTGKKFNTWMTISNEDGTDRGFEKDAVYRLLNCTTINWFSFLAQLAHSVIVKFIKPLTDEKRRCGMIVDDTFLGRTRSKHVELASLVHDHTDGKCKRGFRLLTLGFSDEVSFIPMMFRLLASKQPHLRTNKPNEKQHHKNSLAAKRREDALTSAPDLMLQMLGNSVKMGTPAKHVLFDSWFSAPKTLVATAIPTSPLKPLDTITYKQ